jgi:hypothetical protein
MKLDKARETQPKSPWDEVQWMIRKGYIQLWGVNSDDPVEMRAHVRRVDGRLRAWKVEIMVLTSAPEWPGEDKETIERSRDRLAHNVITQRMLAAAPLVTAETIVNNPHEAWDIEGADLGELPTAPSKLVVPDAKPYPRQFWEDVAATYIKLVVVYGARNPAVAIAEETGAPVATVRGWIAKCRQLDLIAKGSQGRVG